MSETRFWLEDSAQSQSFSFGTTAASGEGLVTINKGTAAASTVVLDAKGSVSVGGDLNLTGNLNITGNINEQSVTNLAVSDINITLNKGGTTAGAAGAGLYIEGDSASTIGKLLFDNSLTSKWKIGDGTTQVEVVTVSGAQTLTNKSIAGTQITGSISGSAASLTTPRNINGVAFDGTANITVTAAAGTLSGTALNSTVVSSSLTSVGTIATGVWNGTIITSAYGGTGNGFTKFAGATTSEKTYTLPDASTTILTTNYTGGLATGIVKNTTSTGALTIAVAGDFPTLNQNTTGSAATLTTARSIYGNSFNGSADITAIIASTYGGTGNGFTKFSGPTTAEKTFTLPNASATILTDASAVTVAQGGTGKTSITLGSVLVGAGTSAPTEVAPGTSGNVLTSNGSTWVSSAPTGTAAYFHEVTITGTQDSSNKVFTLGSAVTGLLLFRQGQALKVGASNDYTVSGTTVTFTAAFVAPRSTDTLMAYGNY